LKPARNPPPDLLDEVHHSASENPIGIETFFVLIDQVADHDHSASENPIGIETWAHDRQRPHRPGDHSASENPIGIETRGGP